MLFAFGNLCSSFCLFYAAQRVRVQETASQVLASFVFFLVLQAEVEALIESRFGGKAWLEVCHSGAFSV